MDKTLKYQSIICAILDKYALIQGIPVEIKSYTVFDKEQHHYQLLSMGWYKQTYVYDVIIHLDIIENQVWIQQNNSDADLVAELLVMGVDSQDIVFGYIMPSKRPLVHFAA
jgi:hypothetical protein